MGLGPSLLAHSMAQNAQAVCRASQGNRPSARGPAALCDLDGHWLRLSAWLLVTASKFQNYRRRSAGDAPSTNEHPSSPSLWPSPPARAGVMESPVGVQMPSHVECARIHHPFPIPTFWFSVDLFLFFRSLSLLLARPPARNLRCTLVPHPSNAWRLNPSIVLDLVQPCWFRLLSDTAPIRRETSARV